MKLPKILLGILAFGGSLFLPALAYSQNTTTAIFENSLAEPWQNWSWGAKVDLNASQDGNGVIRYTPESEWSALYLHSNTDLPAGVADTFEFSVKDQGKARFKVIVSDSNWQQDSSIEADKYKESRGGGWVRYSIPYQELTQGDSINGLIIQETSGQVPSTYIFDDILLKKNGTLSLPVTLPSPSPSSLPAVVEPILPDAASQRPSTSLPVTQFTTGDIPAGTGMAFPDQLADEGQALLLWSNTVATLQVSSAEVTSLTFRARADVCQGSPTLDLLIDGKKHSTHTLSKTAWTSYSVPVSVPAGRHSYGFAFTNDYAAPGCDRNIWMDTLVLSSGHEPASNANDQGRNPQPEDKSPSPVEASRPSASSSQLYIDRNTPAQRQYEEWKHSQPSRAQQIKKIADQPTAKWFGGWSGDIRSAVNSYLQGVPSEQTAVLVAYNIPWRDCSGYSIGGESSMSSYKRWIGDFAQGVQGKSTMVILEPDAIALTNCLDSQQLRERQEMLQYATQVLKSAGAKVYLDAGHSQWMSASEVANRLQQAGVSQADGFSLNVSNYNTLDQETSFGRAVSQLVGNKQFVVDTSRNGSGSNGEWCNPSGRSLGHTPTLNTGNSGAAAYLWIKYPGESDGNCNGGPNAGHWWAEYAVGLAERAQN